MNVLMVNGSPHPRGCTYTALSEIGKPLNAAGITYEIVQLGTHSIRDCIGCGKCRSGNGCVFTDDLVNETVEKARTSDGFIFGTPVYYAHPSGRVLSFLDRAFYSDTAAFAHKPGAAVASARRAGTTASLDVLNKYFTIAEMPVVSSSYWNMVHGNSAKEVAQDTEGLQTMRNIGCNMAWLLRCIALGKENGVTVPATERGYRTNFIR